MNKQNIEECVQNFMATKYSCFIKDQGYFGNYPSQSDINTMEKIGIHYFIDLTCEQDNLEKYKVSSNSFQVNLPIFDRSVPHDIFKVCSDVLAVMFHHVVTKKIDLGNTRLGKHFKEHQEFYKQMWNRIYHHYKFGIYTF